MTEQHKYFGADDPDPRHRAPDAGLAIVGPDDHHGDEADATDDARDDLLLAACDLALRTTQGPVFGPVTWQVRHGQHAAVLGEQGSGRSAFLLALSGRMQGVTGGLLVGDIDGVRHPRQLRKQVGVARITDFAELEPKLTVAEVVDERSLMEGVGVRRGRRRFGELERALDLHFSHFERVDALSALERTQLCLLLAAIRPARYIVCDDIDESLTGHQIDEVYALLDGLAELGQRCVVSVLATSPVPDGAATVLLEPSPESERLALSFAHLRHGRTTGKES